LTGAACAAAAAELCAAAAAELPAEFDVAANVELCPSPASLYFFGLAAPGGDHGGRREALRTIGVNLAGEREVLGLWLGPVGGEGAKQWATMLTELRNRGLQDALIVCCDGLKGLPESIRITWPEATVQTCVVHMVRNSLRYASRKHWKRITTSMREICTAPAVAAAEARFAEFAEEWEATCPAMIQAWRSVWNEFVPFLEFPPSSANWCTRPTRSSR
jgi:transposase-like protein